MQNLREIHRFEMDAIESDPTRKIAQAPGDVLD